MKLYRASLRNQKKISAALGEGQLKMILQSLKAYFINRTEPVPEIPGENGRVFIIVPAGNKKLHFVLISKTYYVYNLAFFKIEQT